MKLSDGRRVNSWNELSYLRNKNKTLKHGGGNVNQHYSQAN